MVKYTFIFFDSFAITVEPFIVLDPNTGDENGGIQIRRLQVGAESGTHLGEPIWRGDLFKLTEGPKDNWDHAHTTWFQGIDAGDRLFDPQLTKDGLSTGPWRNSVTSASWHRHGRS